MYPQYRLKFCNLDKDFQVITILYSCFQILADSEHSAEEDVRRGRSWVAMTFEKNFTQALVERINFSVVDIEDKFLDTSQMRVATDQSSNYVRTQKKIILSQLIFNISLQ